MQPWLNPGGDFHKHWIEQYFQTNLYRDVKRLFPGLDEMRFRRFISLVVPKVLLGPYIAAPIPSTPASDLTM
jgi:hypothetical protein